MARPIKKRRVCRLPEQRGFSPCGKENTETIELTVDEYETIRLIDYHDLDQEECSARMNVSRTTVQNIYDSARKKISDALINGKHLAIRGGSYVVCHNSENCPHTRCCKNHDNVSIKE